MAAFSLKIAPKHDIRNRYPPISTVTAEMGGFSMIPKGNGFDETIKAAVFFNCNSYKIVGFLS